MGGPPWSSDAVALKTDVGPFMLTAPSTGRLQRLVPLRRLDICGSHDNPMICPCLEPWKRSSLLDLSIWDSRRARGRVTRNHKNHGPLKHLKDVFGVTTSVGCPPIYTGFQSIMKVGERLNVGQVDTGGHPKLVQTKSQNH